VLPFPRLWGREAAFVDGHSWVVPRAERSAGERAAMARFLHFLAAHNFEWTRTGHLPAMEAVLATPAFRQLPHRADIAAMAATGVQLPDYVQRQSAIQGLIGEELEAAVTGAKPIDQALADAERRVNELYAQML
jgi:multiple sugar transport system substrate-binding protein